MRGWLNVSIMYTNNNVYSVSLTFKYGIFSCFVKMLTIEYTFNVEFLLYEGLYQLKT